MFILIDGEILRVLVNSSAQIKCDVGSSLPDDKVLLVVWYKNNLPIYSYDTRGAHAGTPSHWRDEDVLEDRAVFRTHKEPAELIINPVKDVRLPSDCSYSTIMTTKPSDVDNVPLASSTEANVSKVSGKQFNNSVAMPPQQPSIFNERRLRIDSRAGPYEEGGNLEVTCVVYGASKKHKFTQWLI
uniref:Ig-like domain-containing protein n=1 Tax=Glossina austeni TaxID=7395 RepID=A0A1A9USK0_GLOAU